MAVTAVDPNDEVPTDHATRQEEEGRRSIERRNTKQSSPRILDQQQPPSRRWTTQILQHLGNTTKERRNSSSVSSPPQQHEDEDPLLTETNNGSSNNDEPTEEILAVSDSTFTLNPNKDESLGYYDGIRLKAAQDVLSTIPLRQEQSHDLDGANNIPDHVTVVLDDVGSPSSLPSPPPPPSSPSVNENKTNSSPPRAFPPSFYPTCEEEKTRSDRSKNSLFVPMEIRSSSDGRLVESILLGHLTSMMTFTENSEWAMAVLLAIHHWNNGIGSVLSMLPSRARQCRVKWTHEFLDTQANPRRTSDIVANDLWKRRPASPATCQEKDEGDIQQEDSWSPQSLIKQSEAAAATAASLRNPRPSAILGAMDSTVTDLLATLTTASHIPLVSPTCFVPNTATVASMVPPLSGLAHAAVDYFLNVVEVTRVGVLYERNAYGESFRMALTHALEHRQRHKDPSTSILLEFTFVSFTDERNKNKCGDSCGGGDSNSTSSLQDAMTELEGTLNEYFLGVVNPSYFSTIVAMVGTNKEIDHDHVWTFVNVQDEAQEVTKKVFWEGTALASGLQGIGILNADVSTSRTASGSATAMERFKEAWKTLNEPEFKTYVKRSQRKQVTSLDATDPKWVPAVLYDSVVALSLAACATTATNVSHATPEILMKAFRHVEFNGVSGRIAFNNKAGTRRQDSVEYSMINVVLDGPGNDEEGLVRFSLRRTASYHVDIHSQAVDGVWRSLAPFQFSNFQKTPPPDGLPAEEKNGIRFGVLVFGWVLCGLLGAVSVLFAILVTIYRNFWVIRASQPVFLLPICLGTLLMSSTIVPLGFQNEVAEYDCVAACMLPWWTFSTGYVLVFSALIAKTMRLNKIMSKDDFIRVKVTPMDVFLPFAGFFALNLMLLLSWNIFSPLKYDVVEVRSDDGSDYFIGSCSYDDDSTVFAQVVLVVGLGLFLVALYEAFRGRNIQTDFAESPYITYALISILESWCVGVPVVVVSWGSSEAYFVVASTVIFGTGMAILLFLFIPKGLAALRVRGMRPRGSMLVLGTRGSSRFSTNSLGTRASSRLSTGSWTPYLMSDGYAKRRTSVSSDKMASYNMGLAYTSGHPSWHSGLIDSASTGGRSLPPRLQRADSFRRFSDSILGTKTDHGSDLYDTMLSPSGSSDEEKEEVGAVLPTSLRLATNANSCSYSPLPTPRRSQFSATFGRETPDSDDVDCESFATVDAPADTEDLGTPELARNRSHTYTNLGRSERSLGAYSSQSGGHRSASSGDASIGEILRSGNLSHRSARRREKIQEELEDSERGNWKPPYMEPSQDGGNWKPLYTEPSLDGEKAEAFENSPQSALLLMDRYGENRGTIGLERLKRYVPRVSTPFANLVAKAATEQTDSHNGESSLRRRRSMLHIPLEGNSEPPLDGYPRRNSSDRMRLSSRAEKLLRSPEVVDQELPPNNPYGNETITWSVPWSSERPQSRNEIDPNAFDTFHRRNSADVFDLKSKEVHLWIEDVRSPRQRTVLSRTMSWRSPKQQQPVQSAMPRSERRRSLTPPSVAEVQTPDSRPRKLPLQSEGPKGTQRRRSITPTSMPDHDSGSTDDDRRTGLLLRTKSWRMSQQRDSNVQQRSFGDPDPFHVVVRRNSADAIDFSSKEVRSWLDEGTSPRRRNLLSRTMSWRPLKNQQEVHSGMQRSERRRSFTPPTVAEGHTTDKEDSRPRRWMDPDPFHVVIRRNSADGVDFESTEDPSRREDEKVPRRRHPLSRTTSWRPQKRQFEVHSGVQRTERRRSFTPPSVPEGQTTELTDCRPRTLPLQTEGSKGPPRRRSITPTSIPDTNVGTTDEDAGTRRTNSLLRTMSWRLLRQRDLNAPQQVQGRRSLTPPSRDADRNGPQRRATLTRTASWRPAPGKDSVGHGLLERRRSLTDGDTSFSDEESFSLRNSFVRNTSWRASDELQPLSFEQRRSLTPPLASIEPDLVPIEEPSSRRRHWRHTLNRTMSWRLPQRRDATGQNATLFPASNLESEVDADNASPPYPRPLRRSLSVTELLEIVLPGQTEVSLGQPLDRRRSIGGTCWDEEQRWEHDIFDSDKPSNIPRRRSLPSVPSEGLRDEIKLNECTPNWNGDHFVEEPTSPLIRRRSNSFTDFVKMKLSRHGGFLTEGRAHDGRGPGRNSELTLEGSATWQESNMSSESTGWRSKLTTTTDAETAFSSEDACPMTTLRPRSRSIGEVVIGSEKSGPATVFSARRRRSTGSRSWDSTVGRRNVIDCWSSVGPDTSHVYSEPPQFEKTENDDNGASFASEDDVADSNYPEMRLALRIALNSLPGRTQPIRLAENHDMIGMDDEHSRRSSQKRTREDPQEDDYDICFDGEIV